MMVHAAPKHVGKYNKYMERTNVVHLVGTNKRLLLTSECTEWKASKYIIWI